MIDNKPNGIGLIRILQPATPSSFRLVCIPGAATSMAYYLALSEQLLPTVEVLVVQYPDGGDADDDAPEEDMVSLADQIFEALDDWTDRPLALFGHRMGAYLAFRVAERLERESPVTLLTLFVSGRAAPPAHVPLGPPSLGCRVVALAGEHDPHTPLPGVRAWRRCTCGRFDLEVFPGSCGYLSSSKREVVNLVHDQLMSLSSLDAEWTAP